MNPILRTALYPLVRAAEATHLKKKKPPKPKAPAAPKPAPPTLAAENHTKKADHNNAITELLIKKEDEVVITNNGIKAIIRGQEYTVRLTRPAHSIAIHQLQDSLTRNRILLEKSAEDMYEMYTKNIETNKAHNKMIAKSKMPKKGLDEWNDKLFRPAIQNALVARANIDLLIPLINMRGGDAEYIGNEALPINDHINRLLDTHESHAAIKLIPPPPPPETDEWTFSSFLITGAIVIIVALLLKAFM